MNDSEYLDMIFKTALKPEPDPQALRALDEAIAIVAKAIESLKGEDSKE